MATELCVSLEEYFSQLFKADAPHCLKLVFEPLCVLISTGRPVRLATDPATLRTSAVVQEQYVVFLLFISYLDCYMHGTAGMLSRSPEVEGIEVLVGSQGWRRSSDVRACIERWSRQHAARGFENEALRDAIEAILSDGFARDPSNIAKRDKGDIRFPYMCSGGRPKICGERSSKLAELSCIPPSCGRNKGCRLGFQPVSDLLQATYTVFEKLDSKTRTAVKPLIGDLLLELDGKGMRVEGVPEAVRAAVAASVIECARGWIDAVDYMDQWREAAQQSAVLAGLRGPEDAPVLLTPLDALQRMQAAMESPGIPPPAMPWLAKADTVPAPPGLSSAPALPASDRGTPHEPSPGPDGLLGRPQRPPPSSAGGPLLRSPLRQSPSSGGDEEAQPSPPEADGAGRREGAGAVMGLDWGRVEKAEQALQLSSFGYPKQAPPSSDAPGPGGWIGPVPGGAAEALVPAPPVPKPVEGGNVWSDALRKMDCPAPSRPLGLPPPAPTIRPAGPPSAPARAPSIFADGISSDMYNDANELPEPARDGPSQAQARALRDSDAPPRRPFSSSAAPYMPNASSRAEPALPSSHLSSGPLPPASGVAASARHAVSGGPSAPSPAAPLPSWQEDSHGRRGGEAKASEGMPPLSAAALSAVQLLRGLTASSADVGAGGSSSQPHLASIDRLPTAGVKRPREGALAEEYRLYPNGGPRAEVDMVANMSRLEPPAHAVDPAPAQAAERHYLAPATGWSAQAAVKREKRVHDSAGSEETGVHPSASGAGAPPPAKAPRLSADAGTVPAAAQAPAPSAPRPRPASAAPSPVPSTSPADVTLDLKNHPDLLQALGTVAKFFTSTVASAPSSLPPRPHPDAAALLQRLQDVFAQAATRDPSVLADALSTLEPAVFEVEQRVAALQPQQFRSNATSSRCSLGTASRGAASTGGVSGVSAKRGLLENGAVVSLPTRAG
ncbi:hypothetical protein HYH03_001038 [Edaphochlamys debaryana]|nr:hypothetical protein HYH03_001038 [Edaphochlamys debaryana]|eukprot:KAG2501230.1 hypothetical protein HYH03_001038 [Edaphochlamys debaryana]